MLIGLLLVAAIYVRALVFTPEEATQGLAQKIFYVHAPSAWVAFLAFGVVGICSGKPRPRSRRNSRPEDFQYPRYQLYFLR